MSWNLRYASHLGYRSVDTPLFRESVGSLDPVAHVDFTADLGFAGMQFALAVTRPPEEIERIAAAMHRRNLEPGCMLYAPFDVVRRALWGSSERDALEERAGHLRASFEVARRLNARHIAILSAADPTRPIALQRVALIENLKRAAEDAEREGVVLCLETLSRRSLPGMLLTRIADAYSVVKAVGTPAVRLIFDTGHVQVMDGDLIENLRAVWDAVEVVQIADNPGRFEPGSGEINFENVLRAVLDLGYQGLIELEHGWSSPSRDAEHQGIVYLRSLDQRSAARAPCDAGRHSS